MAGQLRDMGSDAPFRYRVVRSARRRETLTVTVDAGEVVVRAPLRATIAEIDAFVARHATWIRARLDSPSQARLELSDGARLPYRGDPHAIELHILERGRGLAASEAAPGRLEVSVPARYRGERDAAVRAAVIGWFSSRAAEVADALVSRWAPRLGVAPSRVLIRNQRTRWGSCSTSGAIRLNWRIVCLDEALAEYIVVHELCHLLHTNHSAAFWAAVRAALPDATERRCRLRQAPILL
jgi:predicted metal-dependent hydrolase